MFKKLKQRLEENEGPTERISFTSNKLPGSIVRSTAQDKLNSKEYQPPPEERVSSDTEQPINYEATVCEKEELPSHLASKPHLSYQEIMEAKVSSLQQKCDELSEELSVREAACAAQQSHWERYTQQHEQQVAELRMQIMEIQLERAEREKEYEVKCEGLQLELEKQEKLAHKDRDHWNEQLGQLKAKLEEKDKCIIAEENKCTELEKKAGHYLSQLKAYQSSSESDVVSRLHSEIAELEQRIQSRNLEIQIFERRLAAQAKESKDQWESLLEREEQVAKANTELSAEAEEERLVKRELFKELDKERENSRFKDQEKEELQRQLANQAQIQQSLTSELDQLRCSHTGQVQDLEHLVEEKDHHVKELLHQLNMLRGDAVVLEPQIHPPGMARRTVSIAVQTDQTESEPAMLPLYSNSTEVVKDGPANMTSLDSEEEFEVMRQRQHRLEEELAEKAKIIKVQQQKIMDIKKELRLQKAFPDNEKQESPAPILRVAIASDVNFQYLKHVVIKFICSREDEAFQLVRAISTLLEFSPEEEEHVKKFLNYKMSWFGVIPPPLFTPMQTSSSFK